jgi:hypothetical protein
MDGVWATWLRIRALGQGPRRDVNGIDLGSTRPLLPASARPWAGALLACCAIVVAALGVLFTHQTTADRLDQAVDSRIITWLGGHPSLVP